MAIFNSYVTNYQRVFVLVPALFFVTATIPWPGLNQADARGGSAA